VYWRLVLPLTVEQGKGHLQLHRQLAIDAPVEVKKIA
jgi:hypothetical protein